ncbi:hypothetical protein Zmor_011208 [Zophobas morio]|uniref:DDE-1 domain-containing protein n=1 Tax=Zophobas morio TaxID=2755281 RepID=A0AA38IR72_9CUCU|nr:hypothetical protein Zmor_011208 [Zophobas morio]
MIYCLLPNVTHILQSCDVSIFKSLKEPWKKKEVLKYKQTTNKYITKVTFMPLFKKALDAVSVDSFHNGFRKCGLFPLNEENVDFTQYISKKREELTETLEIANEPEDEKKTDMETYKSIAEYAPNLNNRFWE